MRRRQLRPNDLLRCQELEYRRIADRRSPVHYRSVQCSLARHDGSIPHEWCGRPFGAAPAPRQHSRTPARCANTEVREVGHRKYKAPIRLLEVRCTEPVGHEGECSWSGRAFGAPVKRRASGRHRRVSSATRVERAGPGSAPATSGS